MSDALPVHKNVAQVLSCPDCQHGTRMPLEGDPKTVFLFLTKMQCRKGPLNDWRRRCLVCPHPRVEDTRTEQL